MDKNIAALLREGAKTVAVRFIQDNYRTQNLEDDDFSSPALVEEGHLFSLSKKCYTYVTMLDLKVGDLVVVEARGIPVVVEVAKVHDTVSIMPRETIKYRWIISKVDTGVYRKLMKENAKIEKTVSEAYKAHTRKNFQQLLLAELGLENSTELQNLLFVKGDTK